VLSGEFGLGWEFKRGFGVVVQYWELVGGSGSAVRVDTGKSGKCMRKWDDERMRALEWACKIILV